MTRHRTVQLLHFPPDYVLERDQDYLSANTTIRWANLLVENGLAAEETPRYQNIIDIAPIAAPSRDGRRLDGVYSFYNEFILGLLNLWGRDELGGIRPIVAFGSPVRRWLDSVFSIDLNVLSLDSIQLEDGVSHPILAANHPSFIYNAARRLNDDPDTPEDERLAVISRIMQQDLIAARWQALMGKDPQSDPESVLESCQSYWSAPEQKQRICELSYIQALNEEPDEAAQLCTNQLTPQGEDLLSILLTLTENQRNLVDRIDQRLEKLRNEIGSLDSRELEDIDD